MKSTQFEIVQESAMYIPLIKAYILTLQKIQTTFLINVI